KHNIPIGLFYRDIYWRFDGYKAKVSWHKRLLAIPFYKFDLWWYQQTLNVLYLPSSGMGEYVPAAFTVPKKALPPGFSTEKDDNLIKKAAPSDKKLNLLYVGGMSSDYEMHLLFQAVSELENISLTICTRKTE